MAEYRLAPAAREDMETVWLFSLTKWSAQQTERYVDNLTDAFASLADNSGVGTACDHIREGYRRYPVKRHMVYYRKTSYGIEVMRVLHAQMLASRHFQTN